MTPAIRDKTKSVSYELAVDQNREEGKTVGAGPFDND